MAKDYNFYIYRYVRLDTFKPFYVGKGRDKRAKLLYHHNELCKRIASKHGFEIEYILENLSESQSFTKEQEFIKLYKDLGLCEANFTNGGEGPSGRKLSQETKLKISLAHKGKKKSPEHIKNMSLCRKGIPIKNRWTKGNIFEKSQETKDKISKTQKGKKLSPAHVENIRKARTGWIFSEETKKKISESHKNRSKKHNSGGNNGRG